MKRLLDGLAWIIVSVAALAFVTLVVVMVVKWPDSLIAMAAWGAFAWAGSRLLKKP